MFFKWTDNKNVNFSLFVIEIHVNWKNLTPFDILTGSVLAGKKAKLNCTVVYNMKHCFIVKHRVKWLVFIKDLIWIYLKHILREEAFDGF